MMEISKRTKLEKLDKRGQPFLRWAGSKRKLLPVLLQIVPQRFDRYVEPFVGSACLFFALRPPKAILADINGDLINTYHVVKTDASKLALSLSAFKCTEREYYKVRDSFVGTASLRKQAARFIYLNRFCFNGLYRTNMSGKFNVPYRRVESWKPTNTSGLTDCQSLFEKNADSACSF